MVNVEAIVRILSVPAISGIASVSARNTSHHRGALCEMKRSRPSVFGLNRPPRC